MNEESLFEDTTLTCECLNCEKMFEAEDIRPEEITCPYCHSDDVIIYEDDKNE